MRDIVDAIIRAKSVACNEEIRFFLCGVCLKQRDGKLDVVATDGHMMLVETFDVPVELSHLNEFIIQREDVAKFEDAMGWLQKYYGRKKMIPSDAISLRLSQDGKFIVLAGRGFELTAERIDGQFPDYTKVLPNEDRTNVRVGFDLKKLRAVFESLDRNASSPEHVEMLVDMNNNLNSLLIRTPGSKSQGIVMPVRI